MPAVTILRLPRVSRAAMVGSGTRKSRAMSAVVTPTTSRSASALADLGRERRVAAHQHQAQSLVLDQATGVSHRGSSSLAGVDE